MSWLGDVRFLSVLSLMYILCVNPAVAQNTAAVEPPVSPGIVFLKPPSNSILGTQTITSDVVDIITDDNIYALIKASEFTFVRRGLSNVYRTRLNGRSLQLPNEIIQGLDVNSSVFGVVDKIEIDAVLTLSEPWSRAAYNAKTIRIRQIDLTRVALEWGGIAFAGGGSVLVDDSGLLDGKVNLRVTSWNPEINLTDRLIGAQNSELDALLQVVLIGGELTIPVNFDQGVVKVGILPVGNIPPLLP